MMEPEAVVNQPSKDGTEFDALVANIPSQIAQVSLACGRCAKILDKRFFRQLEDVERDGAHGYADHQV